MIKPELDTSTIIPLMYPIEETFRGIRLLEGEVFTKAIFYDGRTLPYYISNYGRVYSEFKKCILKQYKDESGYFRISIRISPNESVFTGVHKLILMSFYPITDPYRFIPNHKDGIKDHNYLDNLEWVTVSYNTRHALDNGLCNYIGTDNSRSYLTDSQVEQICQYIKDGYRAPQIATMMNLGTESQNERNKICAIIRNISYGSAYMSISMKYDIPGMQGDYRFPEEMAYDICQIMSDPKNKDYNYDDIANVLNIPNERRRYFKSFVIDIFKKAGYTDALKAFPNASKPKQIPKNHKNYYLYFGS